MICTLDKENFCARHKERHVGALRDLALDPGPPGQRMRDWWDKQMGLARNARCKHLGPRVVDAQGNEVKEACAPCNGTPRNVYVCRHPDHAVTTLPACLECRDHEPLVEGRPLIDPIRHLLYHCYPVKGVAWQSNLDMLLRRIEVFNGHRIVAIATDHLTDSAGAVREKLAGHVHEFIEVENDPRRREVATFLPLWSRVQTTDPSHVTFYGHTKGVSPHRAEDVAVRRWVPMLYEMYLDRMPVVHDMLGRFPVVGGFKKLGRGFIGSDVKVKSNSDWHYSGGFCWFRNADVFSRDWRAIDQDWYGIESWPSRLFRGEEAGTLFGEGTLDEMNMYATDTLDRLMPDWERWKAEHADRRTPCA